MALSGVVMLAPVIANDKPIIIYRHSMLYMPILYEYPETTFGGVFETPTDYTDPYVQTLLSNDKVIMPPIQYAQDTLVMNTPTPHPSPPTAQNWLGTDAVGQDVLSRVLYGLRVSLVFSFLLTLVGGVIGVAIGAVMGHFASWVDLLGQRLLEVWIGLPQLFVMMIVASMFKPSFVVLFVIMAMFSWLPFVAVTRVQFLHMKTQGYVMTAKNLGVGSVAIIYRHILPSALMMSLAQLPFVMAMNMTALTALDFLGFGLPVGMASLGELLLQAKNHLDTPHLAFVGFGVMSVVLVLLLFVGEGVKMALIDDTKTWV